jgi:hypothetical protein
MSIANPHAPPQAQVSDPPFRGPVERADAGRRLGAVLLDALFRARIFLPSVIAVGIERAGPMDEGEGVAGIGGLTRLIAGLLWLAGSLALLHHSGQTLGRRLLGAPDRRSGAHGSLSRLTRLRFLVSGVLLALRYAGKICFLLDSALIMGSSRPCLHAPIADTRGVTP